MTSADNKCIISLIIVLITISLPYFGHCDNRINTQQSDSLIQITQFTDTICYAQSTGLIHLVLTDTINHYEIDWSNGDHSMLLNDLNAGTYTVSVSNSQGLIESRDFVIAHFPHSEYQLINDTTSCELLTSIELITPPSGIGIQNIQWSTDDESMKVDQIAHGHYSVSITDMYDCPHELNFSTSFIDTTGPQLILRNLTLELGIDGKIPILFPEDFIAASIDNCSDVIDIFPEQILLNCDHVGINTIHVIANDQFGNITVDSLRIEVKDINEPLIFCPANQTVFSCDTIYYGLPYSFDNCNNLDIHLIEGLPNGSIFPNGENLITFEARDQSGNTAQCQTKIIADYGIDYQITSFEASCFDSNDGALVIQSSSINGPTHFEIENYHGNLLSMMPGTYPFSIVDSVGCMVTDTAFIESPSALILNKIQIIHPGDFNGQNGWINIEVEGGIAPYSYTWYRNGHIISQEQNPEFLIEGNYFVKIKDSYQCEFISEAIEIGLSTSVIETIDDSNIKVYPNPSKNIINIEIPSSERCEELQVISTTGEQILKFHPQSNSFNINLEELNQGMYILRLKIKDLYLHSKISILD